MKYPEHKLSMETALPSSVQCWLGNELEIRGIDSVIYSRYIIHLLLEDHDEECTEYLELFFNPRLDIRSKLKNHKRLHNQEEKKKKAAIECLQAVSEEVFSYFSLLAIYYTPAPEGGGGVYCFTSVLPFVQDIFRRIFLSNC